MYPHSKHWALLFVVASALLQKPISNPQQATDIQELGRLETAWNEAYVRGDADTIGRLCAEDLTVAMSEMPVLTKASSLQILRSGRVRFKRYETSDVRIRVYDNAAVVTGRLERTREAQGHEGNDAWQFTKVYIRRDGNWQVVAWHASTAAS
jgi:hypothetical protein